MTAAETLYQRKMMDACDVVAKLGLAAPDAGASDYAQFQILIGMLRLDVTDADGARKAFNAALQQDRHVQMLSFASPRARQELEDARAKLPPPPHPPSGRAAPPPVTLVHEPAPRPLIRAMDALYQNLALDGAEVMLEFARQSKPLSKEDQVQIALREGILRMEAGEEPEARAKFKQGLELDPNATLPAYRPPKTFQIFTEVRRTLPPPVDISKASAGGNPVEPKPEPTADPGTPLIVLGGLGVVAGLGVLAVSSSDSSSSGSGQIAGGVITAAGVVTAIVGITFNNRPEVLQLRVGVAPANRGGLLVAMGRF